MKLNSEQKGVARGAGESGCLEDVGLDALDVLLGGFTQLTLNANVGALYRADPGHEGERMPSRAGQLETQPSPHDLHALITPPELPNLTQTGT